MDRSPGMFLPISLATAITSSAIESEATNTLVAESCIFSNFSAAIRACPRE